MTSRMQCPQEITTPLEQISVPCPPKPRHRCLFPGCGKSYGRKPDLRRHAKSHDIVAVRFTCPAQYCRMKFTRLDKLRDHMLGGHEDDTLFCCTKRDCSMLLTRDLYANHTEWSYPGFDNTGGSMLWARTCPMPQCGFRIGSLRHCKHDLDGLRLHLLEEHDNKGRMSCATVLEQKGFQFDTGNYNCSLCPQIVSFTTQKEFARHFYHTHLGDCKINHTTDPDAICSLYFGSRIGTGVTSDAIRRHRRTLLFVLPELGWLSGLWEDIKCPHAQW